MQIITCLSCPHHFFIWPYASSYPHLIVHLYKFKQCGKLSSKERREQANMTKHWQQDPKRRERIEAAALEVIAKHGVAGTTYRKVAAMAEVPLGAVSYYFNSMESLLLASFSRLATDVSAVFASRIEQAKNADEACYAVVDIIFGEATSSARTLLLSYELYGFASRHPDMTSVMNTWMRKSRSALSRHFSPAAAVAIDALIEGMTIHRSVIDIEREEVMRMVKQLAML